MNNTLLLDRNWKTVTSMKTHPVLREYSSTQIPNRRADLPKFVVEIYREGDYTFSENFGIDFFNLIAIIIQKTKSKVKLSSGSFHL